MPGNGKGGGPPSKVREKIPVAAGVSGTAITATGAAEMAAPGSVSEPASSAAGGSAGAVQGLFANPTLLVVFGLAILVVLALIASSDD